MKLIFIYNADGDFASSVKGAAHKLVSPDTYPCNLCKLTYPLVSVNHEWRRFVKSLPHEVFFLHRNEFYKQYPDQKQVRLPAVFAEDAPKIRLLIPDVEINKAQNIQELIKLVENSLSKQN